MPSEFRVTLPVPPSVNHLYRNFTTKDGRRMRVHTPQAKAWFTAAGVHIVNERNFLRHNTPWDEKVVMDYWVFWPTHRERDCDNILKAMQDALVEHGIVASDSLILPRAQDFELDRKNPRVEVVLWPKSQEAGPPTTAATSTSATGTS